MTTRRWMLAGIAALGLGMLTLPGVRSFTFGNLTAGGSGSEAAAAEEVACDDDARPAPMDFTLRDIDGDPLNLAELRGSVILLNFWATWCGPCRVEIPHLIELQQEYGDDLVVLGVSIDDTAEMLKPYATEMKVNYPLLVGNGRQDFQDAYGPFWGIPVTVFVARDGLIHKKHSGIASKEQFDHEIRSLL